MFARVFSRAFTLPARLCVFVLLESSAGVRNGDHRRAQSEQRGQEMGDTSSQGTQEYHPLQESETLQCIVCRTHIINALY